MQSIPCTESCDLTGSTQKPRRGPVALDPALLQHVAGGVSEQEAPHGRWLAPLEPEAGDSAAAPHGRW